VRARAVEVLGLIAGLPRLVAGVRHDLCGDALGRREERLEVQQGERGRGSEVVEALAEVVGRDAARRALAAAEQVLDGRLVLEAREAAHDDAARARRQLGERLAAPRFGPFRERLALGVARLLLRVVRRHRGAAHALADLAQDPNGVRVLAQERQLLEVEVRLRLGAAVAPGAEACEQRARVGARALRRERCRREQCRGEQGGEREPRGDRRGLRRVRRRGWHGSRAGVTH
jgi:hypothetical protein